MKTKFALIGATVLVALFSFQPIPAKAEEVVTPAYTVPVGTNTPGIPQTVVQVVPVPAGVQKAAEFEAIALKWLAVAGLVLSALTSLIAKLWGDVSALRDRADRSSLKQGAMQTQLTAVAMATPAGAQALATNPMTTETMQEAIAEQKRAGGILTTPALILAFGILSAAGLVFTSCATNTGNPQKDAMGRATNQALSEAARVLGRAATSALYTVASSELSGNKVDYGHAAASGLWANVNAADTAAAVARVVRAYSAKTAPETAQSAAVAFNTATSAGATASQVVNAIAAVVSTATGAPPAK